VVVGNIGWKLPIPYLNGKESESGAHVINYVYQRRIIRIEYT